MEDWQLIRYIREMWHGDSIDFAPDKNGYLSTTIGVIRQIEMMPEVTGMVFAAVRENSDIVVRSFAVTRTHSESE